MKADFVFNVSHSKKCTLMYSVVFKAFQQANVIEFLKIYKKNKHNTTKSWLISVLFFCNHVLNFLYNS